MITKVRPGSTTQPVYWYRKLSSQSGATQSTINLALGSSSITYASGPKYDTKHRCRWKYCRQDSGFNYINTAYAEWNGRWNAAKRDLVSWVKPQGIYKASDLYRIPGTNPDISSCLSTLLDQVDLNCHDSVLLYSGIVQAVPLVGGAFKFVKIMNDVGKKFVKEFRRKPFWTVVKSAISADFIDRFVISPTIDDARKFLDASNYVVRVMNTLHNRHNYYTAFENTSTEVHNMDSGDRSESYGVNGMGTTGRITFSGPWTKRAYSTTKTYALAKVQYQPDEVSALKLAATRYGVTRPLDSVWDLVPFSFVIDYFTRAGDFISELGDKLSDQEGLKGKIADIHGAWYSHTCSSEWVWDVHTTNGITRVNDYYPTSASAISGKVSSSMKTFVRAPIPDIWSAITNIPDPSNGLFRWDLSATRARTLLELFIQAKL